MFLPLPISALGLHTRVFKVARQQINRQLKIPLDELPPPAKPEGRREVAEQPSATTAERWAIERFPKVPDIGSRTPTVQGTRAGRLRRCLLVEA